MKQIIDQHRRQFLGVAAGTVAVGLGVIDLARAETEAPRSSATNASFGAIKQINAGVLNVGYAEAGPATARVAILLHGWPYDIHSFVDVAPIAGAGRLSRHHPLSARLWHDALPLQRDACATASRRRWPSTSSR